VCECVCVSSLCGSNRCEQVDGLKVYQYYLENYPTACKILKDCKNDTSFTALLEVLNTFIIK